MDAVLIELREKGLTYAEIERITGRDAHNIRKSCVRLGIAYAPDEDHTGRKTERQFAEELKAKNPGFEYVSGYQNNHSDVVVMCTEKGHTFTWNAWNLRAPYGMKCQKCQEERRAEKEAERTAAEIKRTAKSRMNNYMKRREETGTCKWCGALFVRRKGFGKIQKIYCSARCREAMAEDIRKRRPKKDERLKRCQHRQWNISVKRLYERDAGVCWICGKKTDLNDHTSDNSGTIICGDMYPSIDHIVPVSKGGNHTWDNVRLAHRICNSLRGAPDGE